jgi:hypothetical protein
MTDSGAPFAKSPFTHTHAHCACVCVYKETFYVADTVTGVHPQSHQGAGPASAKRGWKRETCLSPGPGRGKEGAGEVAGKFRNATPVAKRRFLCTRMERRNNETSH